MIAYLEGRITETTETSCVIVTDSGVGYEVFLPSHLLAQYKREYCKTHLYICTVVREDAFELFGFSSWGERETFILLRSINRVGARTALSILSVFSPEDLHQICNEENSFALTSVPGIGKKTAQQIFLELQYKLPQAGSIKNSSLRVSQSGTVLQDAVTALLNLGYAESESVNAVKKSLENNSDKDVGEIIRSSLKNLAKG